jgi:hypothetical protein
MNSIARARIRGQEGRSASAANTPLRGVAARSGERVTRLTVADQFAVTADARGDDNALLGHRLKRFERCHKLGEPHRHAWENKEVRQIIISLHLFMSDPPGEDDVLANAEISGQAAQVALFRAAADEEDSEVGLALT